jgi:hypothetical protein
MKFFMRCLLLESQFEATQYTLRVPTKNILPPQNGMSCVFRIAEVIDGRPFVFGSGPDGNTAQVLAAVLI